MQKTSYTLTGRIIGAACMLVLFLATGLNTLAQSKIPVTGRVTDMGGEPLPGVTVYLKDNVSVGTMTDTKGEYSL